LSRWLALYFRKRFLQQPSTAAKRSCASVDSVTPPRIHSKDDAKIRALWIAHAGVSGWVKLPSTLDRWRDDESSSCDDAGFAGAGRQRGPADKHRANASDQCENAWPGEVRTLGTQPSSGGSLPGCGCLKPQAREGLRHRRSCGRRWHNCSGFRQQASCGETRDRAPATPLPPTRAETNRLRQRSDVRTASTRGEKSPSTADHRHSGRARSGDRARYSRHASPQSQVGFKSCPRTSPNSTA